jgi:hypothetical protein
MLFAYLASESICQLEFIHTEGDRNEAKLSVKEKQSKSNPQAISQGGFSNRSRNGFLFFGFIDELCLQGFFNRLIW